MMRRSLVLGVVAAAGLAAGVALLLTQRNPAPAGTPPPASPAATGAGAAIPATAIPYAAATPPPAATAGATAAPDALRRQALAGDGKAAMQWQELDLTCRKAGARPQPLQLDEYFSASPTHAATPDLPAIAIEEHLLLQDQRLDLEQRKTLAAQIAERLTALCRDHVAASAAERYTIAAIAARRGPKRALWNFVQQPPFVEADGRSADPELQRRWAAEAPQLLQERSLGSDTDAVLALGLAYLPGFDAVPAPPLPPNGLLNAAVADDAEQAYRWLSLYVHMHPPSPQLSDKAQQWLAELGGRLDAEQREAAQRWVSDYRSRQAAAAAAEN
jgi:hypothetical protein